MRISIFDMFEGYAQDEAKHTSASAISAERVKDLTLAEIKRQDAQIEIAEEKSPRRALRTTLIAVAAALLLAATALAIAVFTTGEIPESVRRLVGMDEETVAEYIEYDSIVFAPKAHYSDIHHEAKGELYITREQTIRSENLLTQDFGVSTVTLEQCEDYVWRWLFEDGKTCVEALPKESSLERLRQESKQPLPWHWRSLGMRSVFILPAEDDRPFTVMLCAGYESEDGKTFNVERVSAPFTIEPSRAYDAVYIPLDEPIEFSFGSEGKTGYITSIEITTDKLLVMAAMEGITELSESTYGDKRTLTGEEWLAANKELMRQYGDYSVFLSGMVIELKSGEEIKDGEFSSLLRSGFMTGAYENDECVAFADWRSAFDTQQVVSVTLGGRTFSAAEN